MKRGCGATQRAEGQPKSADSLLASCPSRQRIVQIHPTLSCNLRCVHCYSSSSPEHRNTLPPSALCRVIDDAVAMGYEACAVSGGEPLLYDGLEHVLSHARARGLRTTVTTNATLLDERRLRALIAGADLVAVSVDGPPELHNVIRASAHAFTKTCSGLAALREHHLKFAIIHTLTRESWEHLPWLASFAAEQGASLLQIHPLEMTGRAASDMTAFQVDHETLCRAFLLLLALSAEYGPELAIQFDVFLRDLMMREPELVYADRLGGWDTVDQFDEMNIADLLGVLVIEPDGVAVPVSYGMSRQFAWCNVQDSSLRATWPDFAKTRYSRFRELCNIVWTRIAQTETGPFVNWHELIVSASQDFAHAVSGTSRMPLPLTA